MSLTDVSNFDLMINIKPPGKMMGIVVSKWDDLQVGELVAWYRTTGAGMTKKHLRDIGTVVESNQDEGNVKVMICDEVKTFIYMNSTAQSVLHKPEENEFHF